MAGGRRSTKIAPPNSAVFLGRDLAREGSPEVMRVEGGRTQAPTSMATPECWHPRKREPNQGRSLSILDDVRRRLSADSKLRTRNAGRGGEREVWQLRFQQPRYSPRIAAPDRGPCQLTPTNRKPNFRPTSSKTFKRRRDRRHTLARWPPPG